MQFCGTRKGAQLSIYLYYIIYLGIQKEKREREILNHIQNRGYTCSLFYQHQNILYFSFVQYTTERASTSALNSCRHGITCRRWRPISALNSVNLRRQRHEWTNGKACSARNAEGDPCRKFSVSNTVTTHSKQMEIVVRCLARLARLGENMF